MTLAIALLFTQIAKLLVRLKRVIETELAVRQAITELNEMNDYMLRDLGIARGEIEHVVRRPDARTASVVPTIVAGTRRSDHSVRSLPHQAAI